MKKLIGILVFCGFNVFASDFKSGHPFYASQEKSLARDTLIISFHGAPAKLSLLDQGYLSLLQEAIKEGPGTMSVTDYQDQLFGLGAEIEAGVQANVFSLFVKAPPENFAKTLELLKATLKNLRMSEADFATYKERVLASSEANFEQMRTVTVYFATRNYLNNYSNEVEQIKNGDSSPTAIKKLSFVGFQKVIPQVFDFASSYFTFIGPTDSAQVKMQLQTELQDWLQQKYVEKKIQRAEIPSGVEKSVYIINKKGATDHQVFMLFPQMFPREKPEWITGSINMDLLGGGLHSDLGKTLRGERGLTYGVAGNMSSNLLPFWWVWSFAGSQHIKGLLQGIPEVIEKYKRKKISNEQISEAKKRIKNSFLSGAETAKDRLLTKNWYIANGVPLKAYEQYLSRLSSITWQQVAKYQKDLQSEKYILYLMGDKEVLLPILKEIGYSDQQIKVSEFTSLE